MSVDEHKTAADYPPENVRWLWRNRIPEGFVTMIAGKPSGGKSLLSAHLASDVTRRGHNVIYSSTENPKKEMTIPRLIAARAVRERVDIRRFILPHDLGRLEKTIISDNVRLVMFDPISDHLTVSRHSDAIRSVSLPLVDIAERTGCAIVLQEHILRDASPRMSPLRAVPGSGSGLPAAAQMVFIIGRDPEDDEHVLLCPAKANLVDELRALEFGFDEADVPGVDAPIGVLRYMGETTFNARKLLRGSESEDDHRPPEKMAAACKWLTDYLANAPNYRAKAMDVHEDAMNHGHTRRTLRRAADDMGLVKDPPGGSRNCTWALPQGLIDILGDQDG